MLRNHQKSNEIERKQQLKPIKTDRSFPNPSKHKACLEKDPNPAKVRSIKTKKKRGHVQKPKMQKFKTQKLNIQKLKKSKTQKNKNKTKLKNTKT